MDAIAEETQEKKRDSEVMRAFGDRLYNQFTINEAYRRPKEQEWLESLRQYKGLYDPDTKIDPKNSKVYPKITRSKVNIVLSRLHEMLFPENDRNFEIKTTPEPRISRDTVMAIAKSLVKQDEKSGTPILPTADELHLAIKKFCDATCEKMTDVIDDQLIEMDYPEETKKVLRSGLMYGTGVLKGPMIEKRTKRIWEEKTRGDFQEAEKSEDVPYYEFVRLWDWYPDMSVTEIKQMEGSFQRHIMNKHDIRQLIKRDDFYADIIKEYLEAHPNGDYVPRNWEVDLQVIEVEAGAGKSKVTSSQGSTWTEDASRSTYRKTGKKYQVLEYWGYIDGNDLKNCGVDVEDETLEYGANIWILGKHIISAKIFKGAVNKYKAFFYEKDETSLFGEGLARIMRHSQIAISAGARMVLDNGACVSGPQLEVNWSLMAPNADISSFYPRKIWYREGRGVEAQYPALRPLNFDSHIPELLSIIDAFKQFGDEETTLPTWMIGQMVNNETAQATSGRMATITISIKDVVKNFDTFTENVIQELYGWNMDFNPRTDIKGDYNVKARGVSSLVMKEIRMQALNQFSTTLAPEDWVYLDRRDFLKERLKAHDINIPLKTEEEADEVRVKQQNSITQQLMLEMTKAEIAYKKAQTMAQLTKAKDHNVEANIKASTPPAPGEDGRVADAELMKKQAEIDQINDKSRIAAEKHQLEAAKMGEEMQEKKLQGRVKMAQEAANMEHKHGIEAAGAAHAMKLKSDESKHGMKVKEKVATIKAKQKPAKPAATPKKTP
jgi:hypothetical protein